MAGRAKDNRKRAAGFKQMYGIADNWQMLDLVDIGIAANYDSRSYFQTTISGESHWYGSSFEYGDYTDSFDLSNHRESTINPIPLGTLTDYDGRW